LPFRPPYLFFFGGKVLCGPAFLAAFALTISPGEAALLAAFFATAFFTAGFAGAGFLSSGPFFLGGAAFLSNGPLPLGGLFCAS